MRIRGRTLFVVPTRDNYKIVERKSSIFPKVSDFWLDWCKMKINLDWKKYRAIHYFTISRVIIIFAYSRKLFMGTFCGIVSLEMETVANDWLASVGN